MPEAEGLPSCVRAARAALLSGGVHASTRAHGDPSRGVLSLRPGRTRFVRSSAPERMGACGGIVDPTSRLFNFTKG